MDFNFGKFSSREGFGGYQPNDNQPFTPYSN